MSEIFASFPWIPVAVSVLLALVPVIIWTKLLFHKSAERKRSLIWIFIGGSLTVVPIFLLQILWEYFPVLDPFQYIETLIVSETNVFLATFVVVGIMEEIVKHLVVRITDRCHPELFETIKDSLQMSIVSALGFAFAENIFYFTNIWLNLGMADLVSAFIFRSIFTAAGHMIFSAIFGYYYGIAKYAADITAQAKEQGREFLFSRILRKMFGWKTYQIFREWKILQGLLLALGIHAVFNFCLQLGLILPVIGLIIVSGLYVYYLLKRTTSNLLFSFGEKKQSTMAMTDEKVVIELLGMWSKEGRYKEVMETCDRLLKRDPDNNVVKIFKAKSRENQKLRHFYDSLKGVFKKTEAPGTTAPGTAAQAATAPTAPTISKENEKVIAEAMDMWYREGNYKQVTEVANRLLAKNPNSQGAKLILQKAFDKQKMQGMFDSLAKIFSEDEAEQN